MFRKSRQSKSFKKKIFFYIFLLGAIIILIFFINLVFNSKDTLFISPLGKSNIDSANVGKILKGKNIAFSSVIVLSDSSFMIGILNNGQVRLSSQKDLEKQISSLQRILEELTIEGKPFKSIDFRYSEPILAF